MAIRSQNTIPLRAIIFAYRQGFLCLEGLDHFTDNPEEIERDGQFFSFEFKGRQFKIQHVGDAEFVPLTACVPDGIGG